MKKIFLSLCLVASAAQATETIPIYSPYSPSHSGTPATQKIIDVANNQQKDFKFILEFRPGGQQLIAVKEMDRSPQNSLSVVAPKFVEHMNSKKVLKEDYVPIFALGDACWVVISNLGDTDKGVASLSGTSELIVGGVGIGNAAHLTSLQLGEKFKFKPRYVTFKSNFDALVLMVGKGEVNMVLERYSSYLQFKDKAKLNVLAASCPTRLAQAPNVKTLAEQGINAPYVFNIFVANKAMDDKKRRNIRTVLESAAKTVGEDEILRLSDMKPPIFSGITIENYYENSINTVSVLLEKHHKSIQDAQNNK